MRYTSKVVDIPRNETLVLELPFNAEYIFCRLLSGPKIASGVSMTLDDGDDIMFIAEQMSLDFKFKKLTVKVNWVNMNQESITLFYLITGEGQTTDPTKEELVSQLEVTVNELENIGTQ